jgi:hypothetical protein
MGIELINQNLRLSGREGGILPVGRALPELEPTKLAKLVPFYPGANIHATLAITTRLKGRGTVCN